MRRNSTYQNHLTLFWLSLWLLLGHSLSALYPLIPSFVGVVFCYLLLHAQDREKNAIPLLLGFIYVCLYDLNKGFYLFSYVILFILVYQFVVHKVQVTFTCNNCILAVYVSIAYLGHYALNTFLAYLDNETFPYFSSYYFYYIAVDSILSFMFFRIVR
jgi:hypothetical protein